MFRLKVQDENKREGGNNDNQQPQEQAHVLDPNTEPSQEATPEQIRLKRLAMFDRLSSSKTSTHTQQNQESNVDGKKKLKLIDDPMEIDYDFHEEEVPSQISSPQKKKINPQEKFEHELLTRVLELRNISLPIKIFPENVNRYSVVLHGEVLLFEKLNTMKSSHDIVRFLNRAISTTSEELNRENARGDKKSPQKINALNKLLEMELNYLQLCFSEDDCFTMSSITVQDLLNLLLEDENARSELDELVLKQLIQTSTTSKLHRLWENVIGELSSRFSKFTFLDKYYSYLSCFNRLTKYKEIAQIVVNHSKWLPAIKAGSSMEYNTILGPFFRLSAYYDHPRVGEQFFGGGQLNGITQKDLDLKRATLRNEINMYQDNLHKIFMNFIRPKETRAKAMEWLYAAIEGNKSRLKMHEDVTTSSTESFLTNFCGLMLRLCEPFLKPEAEKYKTIDADYPMVNKHVNFSDDTHIIATEQGAKELYAEDRQKGREFNFNTECFFLCYRALKLGIMKTLEKYQNVLVSYNDIRREMKNLSKDDPRYAQAERDLQKMLVIIVCAEVHILNPILHSRILLFYRFASKFLLLTAAPNKEDGKLIADKSESNRIPLAFKCLSEFMVVDIIEFCKFLSLRSVESFSSGDELEQILTMLITFTHYDHYIKNPYVRAKVPELYCSFIPKGFNGNPRDKDLPSSLQNLLMKHTASQQHLMPAFIDLYIDMEHTGSSHQFYEKFTPRFYISLLFKFLWQFDIYRKAFVNETNKNTQFIKFFNLMLNDATYLLDESLKLLANIHTYEQEQPSTVNSQQMAQRRREEQQLRGYMQLARETVHMMAYMSKDVPQPFLRPEMRDRVASMLNYFLVELAGPKCQNLRVKNPEKYNFNAKELLSEITDAYVHFSKFDEFVVAVAQDSRSFKPEVFDRVVGILNKIGTRPVTHINQFQEFAKKAKETAHKVRTEEQDLGDVPEEFLDPITYTLMEDPVLLPTSKVIIDRSTIERHLLNDQTDPFNRSYLTQDMLQEATEIKQRIQQWRASRKK